MSHQTEQDQGCRPIQERQVVAYLLAHPDFLLNHPEVLAVIDVPHRLPAGVASLIEYQAQRLRLQLATERRRLAHLIARAREYETLVNRLHALSLRLIAIERPDQFCHLVRETLPRAFGADAMMLKLFARHGPANVISDPLAASFKEFIDHHRALCGPLKAKQAQILFGETGAIIQSAAIIPLQTEEQWGVIALGNTDPGHFSPDANIDILSRLGELLSQKLRTVPIGHCQ